MSATPCPSPVAPAGVLRGRRRRKPRQQPDPHGAARVAPATARAAPSLPALTPIPAAPAPAPAAPVPAPAAPAAAPAGQIPDRILDLLQGIALFGDLDRQELRVVLRTASPVQFAPGEVICRQGEPGDCMYVLQAGEVSINVRGAGGKMVPVATLKGGDLLGEMTLVDDAPRSADVVAATEVRAFRIDRDRFDVLREALHPAAFKILRRIALTVCGRLRNVNDAVSRLVGVEGSEKRPDGPGGVKTRQAEDDKQEARSFWSGLLDRVRGG